MIKNFKTKNTLFQILAYYDWNKFSRPNLDIDNNNKVKLYDHSRSKKNLNYVDIGYICINKQSIENIKFHKRLSLSKHIIPKLIKKGSVTAYRTYNLYCTVGTMDRLMRAKIMLSDRKFIFLDRDGVLNQKPKKGYYVSNLSEIIWNQGSLNALKALKKKNYETIIVTNQAGIGRGMIKNEIVRSIHSKMSDDVRSYGGSLDYFYVCPHHWLKKCFCRKPSPGLFLKAQYDLNLDFTKIYYIGDQKTDKEVAQKLDIKYLNLNKKNKLNKLIKKLI
jgi:histidinol-phosphate phosphatase family protein